MTFKSNPLEIFSNFIEKIMQLKITFKKSKTVFRFRQSYVKFNGFSPKFEVLQVTSFGKNISSHCS